MFLVNSEVYKPRDMNEISELPVSTQSLKICVSIRNILGKGNTEILKKLVDGFRIKFSRCFCLIAKFICHVV